MSYSHDHHDLDVLAGKDHELTLSTAAIFGIFFGLVVLCAIFFGFGYSLGGHKSQGGLPSESASSTTPANFSAFKPAAGQPAGTHPDTTHTASAAAATTAPPPESTDESATPSDTPAAPAPVVRASPPPAARAIPAPAIATPAAPATASFLVQVAAISTAHQEDANLLLNALRAKGYAVSAHPEPDNFIHLLIGPFTTRPAAEAMRQHLLTDGYTAYIK